MIALRHASAVGLRTDAALLFDRDGTLIEDVPTYVRRPEDVRLLPAVHMAAPLLRELAVPVTIVTNQSGIGRGVVSGADVLAAHRHVVERLHAIGFPVHWTFICPHAPEHGCGCRKPAPGLLLAAADAAGTPVSDMCMIGDNLRDIQAGLAAGMPSILVRPGHGRDIESALASAGSFDSSSSSRSWLTVEDVGAAVHTFAGSVMQHADVPQIHAVARR